MIQFKDITVFFGDLNWPVSKVGLLYHWTAYESIPAQILVTGLSAKPDNFPRAISLIPKVKPRFQGPWIFLFFLRKIPENSSRTNSEIYQIVVTGALAPDTHSRWVLFLLQVRQLNFGSRSW